MTRATLAFCAAAALGQAAWLLAQRPTDVPVAWSEPFLLTFLAGPPLFLGLMFWRRRTAPRLWLALAVLLALVWFVPNLVASLRQPADAEGPGAEPFLASLVQWGVVLAVWLGLILRERAGRPRA